MHKTILMMFFAVVSSSALAEWVYIGKTEKEEPSTYYADPDTIRKSGNKVKMWILYDYTMAQTNATKPYLSIKAGWKFDCKEEQIQILYELLFTENMGEGKLVRSLGLHNNNWRPVAPGAINAHLWKFACGK